MTTASSGGAALPVEGDDQSVAEVADRIAKNIPIASRKGYSR